MGPFSLRFAVLFCAGLCWWARAQQSAGADPVQRRVKDGDAAFGHGDYEIARRSFENAWQVAQRLPADAPVRYEILKRLTATTAASGQFAEAKRYLQQAVEWRESTVGPNDPKILEDLLLSINLDLRTKDFDRALATAERVRAMHIAAYTADSLPVADDFLRVGQIYLAERKVQEAARALSTADGLRTKFAGSLDPGLLPILDGLNEAFRAIAGGGGTGAEAIYRQALTIRETLYGEDSTQLISTLEGLADTYAAGGEYIAAEPVYERLLSLWESLVGKDHPMVAITLDKLVVFYAKEGKPDKAREALARSVAIRARFLAVGLSHEASDKIAQGRRDQAMTLYNRALAALGPPGPSNEDLIAQIRKSLIDIQKPTAK